MQFKLRSVAATIATMCVGLASCSVTKGPISGTVFSESTKAPIAGAVVVALWSAEAGNFLQSSSICYHTAAAITDSNGKFNIPKWSNSKTDGDIWTTNQHVVIGAYMHGMALKFQPLDDATQTTIALHPYTYSNEDRLYYLSHMSGSYCTQYDKESKQAALLLIKEAYKEAAELKTKDPGQEYIVRDMKKSIQEMQDFN